MNILKNIWNYLTAWTKTKTTEAVTAVEAPIEAARTYVRDANGRFATKVAAVESEAKIAVETPYKEVEDYVKEKGIALEQATQELNAEQQQNVTGSGPHGSWNPTEGGQNG